MSIHALYLPLWLVCAVHATECRPETAWLVIKATPSERTEICASAYYRSHWPKTIRINDADYRTTLACRD